ncbi:MAG: hypothetical protein JWM59_1142, partial [Verrucomicrobiales bacterium]|nr:hypothetical protein [Verrucomicrobiales bacterium]
PSSRLETATASMIHAPLLLAPRGVSIDLNEQSAPQRFTSLANVRQIIINSGSGAPLVSGLASVTGSTTIRITGRANMRFPALSSLASLASITVDSGSKAEFDGVTGYTHPPNVDVTWRAHNPGSELVFTNLVRIQGPDTPGEYLQIQAGSGGKVLFPSLMQIIREGDNDNSANSGVALSVSGTGMLAAPLLYLFRDNDTRPNSSLSLSAGGGLSLPGLSQAGLLGVKLTGVSLPAQPILPKPNFTMAGTNIIFVVPSLAGHTYQLQQTASPGTVGWTNAGVPQAGSNSVLSFSTPMQGSKKFYRFMITPWP